MKETVARMFAVVVVVAGQEGARELVPLLRRLAEGTPSNSPTPSKPRPLRASASMYASLVAAAFVDQCQQHARDHVPRACGIGNVEG
jgi:hypothetical protein